MGACFISPGVDLLTLWRWLFPFASDNRDEGVEGGGPWRVPEGATALLAPQPIGSTPLPEANSFCSLQLRSRSISRAMQFPSYFEATATVR